MSIIKILLASNRMRIAEHVQNTAAHALDIQMVAQATTLEATLQACHREQPDVLLLDPELPFSDPAEVVRLIRGIYPDLIIIGCSTLIDVEEIRALLRVGAAGFVITTAQVGDLSISLRLAVAGKVVFSQEVINTLVKHADDSSAVRDLASQIS